MAVTAGWYTDPWGEAPLRWWDGGQWTAWTHAPETPVAQVAPAVPDVVEPRRVSGGALAALLGGAERVAVVDVETTGVFSADRVVEVAVVTVDRTGAVVNEFECLTNPLRDPGPTWLHGLTPSALRDAPLFEDIAMHLASLLDGAVVAAHNLPFDRRLLGTEFARAGIDVDWGQGLDTLRAVGCKLGVACADYGIHLDGAHRALHDARATAQLLLRVADAFDGCRPAAAYYSPCGTPPRVLTREGRTVETQRPYVIDLARGVHAAEDVAPYVALLDAAVGDLRLDSEERLELACLAESLGLSERSRARAHREFLNGLIDAALDDGIVTDEEFDQLCRVAALLEVDDTVVTGRTNPYRLTTGAIPPRPGLQVCFTGAALRPDGEPLDRDDLEAHARRYGLEPVGSVTVNNCQLLVAADPESLSSKAKKAQQYGIPVASVEDFLVALAGGSPIPVRKLPAKGVGLVCGSCGHSWIAARRKSDPICAECRGERAKPNRGVTPTPAPAVAPPLIETLVCVQCLRNWERPRTRGRRPMRCPDCTGSAAGTARS